MNLQPGIYKATLQGACLTEAKTGTSQIAYEFITDSVLDSSGEYVDCPSVTRTIFRALTENTIDYAVADLKRLGYDRDNFDDISPDSPNAFDFSGIEVQVEMRIEEGPDGREREKWEFSHKAARKKLEATGVSKLNALFGSKLRAANADNGTRAPVARVASTRTPQPVKPVQAAAANGQADDGVPF